VFDSLPTAGAVVLAKLDYYEDFYRVLADDIHRFDKLERGQSFQEPGFDSWEAFDRGDWVTSLALIEKCRPSFSEYYAGMTSRGFTCRRVRVVQRPVTPYLQWEMHVLRLRAELGEDIRVVDAALLREAEGKRPVPELVILGNAALYEVMYDDEGVSAGARRFMEQALIEKTAAEVDSLHTRGEVFSTFFAREIAPLPPPV
jgi:hypothetical protein